MPLVSLAVVPILVLFPPPLRRLRRFLLSTVPHATPHRLRPLRVCVPSLAFIHLCSPTWFPLSNALALAGAKLHWNHLSPCSSLLSRLPRCPSPAALSPLRRSATTRTIFILTATRLRVSAAATALMHRLFAAYPYMSIYHSICIYIYIYISMCIYMRIFFGMLTGLCRGYVT